jgi:alcohol dehydrogenase
VTPGTVLGREAVGIVVATGSAVTTLAEGDRVLVSCISSCGRCRFCKETRYGRCTGGGGWILGHTTDGVHAELARIPFADTSLYKVPEQLSDEQVLLLADILPIAYEVGVLNSNVTPGDTIAIVGAGPIGLAAIVARPPSDAPLGCISSRPGTSHWRCTQVALPRASLRRRSTPSVRAPRRSFATLSQK